MHFQKVEITERGTCKYVYVYVYIHIYKYMFALQLVADEFFIINFYYQKMKE